MAETDSISTNELKSLIIQLASKISGLDSKVTGFSEQILSEVKRGVGIKTEFSSSKQEASISKNLDDNVDLIGSVVNSETRGSDRELCTLGPTQPVEPSFNTDDNCPDPIDSEVNSETNGSERELCSLGPTQTVVLGSNTDDNCPGEPTTCTVEKRLVNVLQKSIYFDLESLTVNMSEAGYLQTGDNSQLIINKNDVDFDKFKEEILDKMDSGHKEILDVLKNFKDQYNRNTKSDKGYPDEVSKALSYIINEVEKIIVWQNQLVNQGVSISSQIKEVFHSVQGSNKSLTDQLSSANSRNETLQSELNSEMACIRRLEEEKRILKKELENVKDNNQELQQQIGHIKMTREAFEFCFDISTMNENVFASEDHLKISNTYSRETPVRNRNGSKYIGVFANKPVKPNQDICFDVDVQYKIKQALGSKEMIFEVAVTNKMTLSSNTFDDTGWSFGAISSRAAEIIPTYRLFGMINIQRQPGYSGSDPPYKVILGVWRKDDRKRENQIGYGTPGNQFSGLYRVTIQRSKSTLTIEDYNQKTMVYEFNDLEKDGDLWPSFGVYNSLKVDVVLTLKPQYKKLNA